MVSSAVPCTSYGVLLRDTANSDLDEIAEQVRRLGYAILDSGFQPEELRQISDAFDRTRADYIAAWGESRLREIDEFHTVRAPLALGDSAFVRLATNRSLLGTLNRLILGKYILNQQNGIVNPPGQTYNQGLWHRDLPYQHFTSSSPLAINALFCVDDFTCENGSTFVLPATHKSVSYPTDSYVKRNAVQVEAKAGQYILLDCMLFHSGGFNHSEKERRAVNNVYTIPYFKQQIKLPEVMRSATLTPEEKDLFGFRYQESVSIDQYLFGREK